MSDPSGLEQAATQSTRENQLRFVLTVGARRWKLVLLFTMCLSLAYGAFGYWTRVDVPRQHVASTRLILKPSMWETGILKDVAGRPIFDNTPQALVDRADLTALSEKIVRAMVEEDLLQGGQLGGTATEDEYANKSGEVSRMLTMDVIPQSSRIRVSAQSHNIDEARQVANLAAQIFAEENHQFQVEGAKRTGDFVNQNIDELRGRLDVAQNKLLAVRKDMGYKTYSQLTGEMETMTRQIAEARTTREEVLAKMTGVEAELREKGDKLPASLGQITDSVVGQLLGELDSLWAKRFEMSVVYEDAFEPLKDLQAEIDEKELAVLDAYRRLDTGVNGGSAVWREIQSLRKQYVSHQLQISSLDVRRSTLEKMLAQAEKILPDLAEKNKAYERVTREADQFRAELSRLLDVEFRILNAIRRGVGQLEREGGVETHDAALGLIQKTTWWFNFLIGGLVGFLAGAGLAIMLEMLDTSIRNIEDISTYIGLEVIGTIPYMRFGASKRRLRGDYVPAKDEENVDACIVTQHDPKSPISEAYRTLRTNFQFATIKEKPQTLVVTSSVPGEGKTTTAVNMAVTFADSGLRVLIIDTDLRRPHVHHVLKMRRGPGLADILREGSDYRTVIRETSVRNLSIISSGRVPPNPSELIGSKRMKGLMTELGKEFDMVICDAPSVLVVTDPVLLATDVDAVVLVVAVNNARRETIFRARQLLDTAQANVAGVVLNGLEATRRHYYYYYYYYEDSASRRRRRWIHLG